MEYYIFMLIYEIWAIYAGYKVMTGRFAWLEEEQAINRMMKFAVCWFVGNLIAAFYLLFGILKFIKALAS